MHGWDLDVKERKRNLKYAEMELWSLFKMVMLRK